jgi:hypothetical protein
MRGQHPSATFREIETEVDLRLAQLRARLLEHTAQTRPATDWATQPPEQQPPCPDCAVPLTRSGRQTRHLRSHQGQTVALTRQYGTCPRCGRGLFPPR